MNPATLIPRAGLAACRRSTFPCSSYPSFAPSRSQVERFEQCREFVNSRLNNAQIMPQIVLQLASSFVLRFPGEGLGCSMPSLHHEIGGQYGAQKVSVLGHPTMVDDVTVMSDQWWISSSLLWSPGGKQGVLTQGLH